jgi:hypothetical protein
MNNVPKRSRSFISAMGIVVLATFVGMGVASIITTLRTGGVSKKHAADLIAQSMPFLKIGGAGGFIVGVVVAICIAKARPETRTWLDQRLIRRDRPRIYLGAPMFVIAVLALFMERLPRLVGESAFPYVALGIALAVIAISLFLYDRIPQRFIIPIGIVGWILAAAVGVGVAIYMSGPSWNR